MPSVACTNCDKRYRVDDSAAGKKFACKQCGAIVRVPALATASNPAPVAAPVPKAVPAKAAVKSAAPAPMPVVKAKRPAPPPPPPIEPSEPYELSEPEPSGDEGTDLAAMSSLESTGDVDDTVPFTATTQSTRTAKTSRATKPKPARNFSMPRIGFRFNRLVLIAIGLGIGLMVWGGKEWMLANSASDTVQDITCADLGAHGPGDNAHVRVTNYVATTGYIAWKSSAGDFETVWYPIIPPNAFKLPPGKVLKGNSKIVPDSIIDSGDVHVLIKTHTAKNEGDVESAMNRDSVEGLVINKIESLTQDERDKLHEKYPAMSDNNCYIVEDGRQPKGGLGVFGLIGGALLALYGLFLMFKPA